MVDLDPSITAAIGGLGACIVHLYHRTGQLERRLREDAKAYARALEGHAHELKSLAVRAIAAQEAQAEVLQALNSTIQQMRNGDGRA